MSNAPNNSDTAPTLRRTLGFWALLAYGVGDILGAGIYGLVGKIAGTAGMAAWMSFLVTVVVAGLTALSYAELGGRYPRAGGESHFCKTAFRRESPALLIGFFVFSSGIVSIATVSRVFVGYLLDFFPQAVLAIEWTLLVAFVGLLAVSRGEIAPQAVEHETSWSWLAIFQGSALAFFAFIGFEDMVNVSEEVKRPRRDLPLAIIGSMTVAAILYIAVAWVATEVVPPNELAEADGPLTEVVRRAMPKFPAGMFAIIALFAVANTGLLNFIMGSRLLYGMSQQRLLPKWLDTVHSKTQTPHRAILVILVAALTLAFSGSLAILAGTTNVLLLLVFFTVNLSLMVIKQRSADRPEGFRVPIVFPALGSLTCLAMLGFAPLESILRALVVIGVGLAIVATHWWRHRGSGNGSTQENL